MRRVVHSNATAAWYHALANISMYGTHYSPRGFDTAEIMNNTCAFDMRYPVVVSPARKLGYGFMAAEAFWILSGDNSVAGIAPYNKNIKKFSDNGLTFAGAYGPRFLRQLDYTVDTLVSDSQTRQAVISIWNENPATSKDIPCTLSLVFSIRDRKMHCAVTMRSSDIWLGLPYDFFNFTMMAMMVGAKYTEKTGIRLIPGVLNWTGVSSHLYMTDKIGASKVLDERNTYPEPDDMMLPDNIMHSSFALMQSLNGLRQLKKFPGIMMMGEGV